MNFLYDKYSDMILEISNFEIDSEFIRKGAQSYSKFTNYTTDTQITEVKFTVKDLYWKELRDNLFWPKGETYVPKREIYFIIKEVEFKLSGCYINSYQDNNHSLFIITLSCDYYEIGKFPELIPIYRDKKIDQILK